MDKEVLKKIIINFIINKIKNYEFYSSEEKSFFDDDKEKHKQGITTLIFRSKKYNDVLDLECYFRWNEDNKFELDNEFSIEDIEEGINMKFLSFPEFDYFGFEKELERNLISHLIKTKEELIKCINTSINGWN